MTLLPWHIYYCGTLQCAKLFSGAVCLNGDGDDDDDRDDDGDDRDDNDDGDDRYDDGDDRDVDNDDDDDDADDGYPAYSHQSDSHQVGIWHHDEGWENDTVKFPPYTYINVWGTTW